MTQPSDDGLKFFGIITASVTHELNNILSIIDQSAGLVEDFMANPDSGVPLTEEKLKQITAKIRKLSIIDQSAGLVEDFMANPDSGVPLTEEKLKQITAKIRKNSQRGIGFIKHLNSFAHSTDEPGISFNANTMLENWAALTKRFADLKARKLGRPDKTVRRS